METIDVQTYSGAGPYPINTRALSNKAQQAIAGKPGKAHGIKKIRLECVYTIAALSAMTGDTPGYRAEELLKRLEIKVKGWARSACYAGGRALAEFKRVQEGKVVSTDPGTMSDADATLTRRVVYEFSFWDERLAMRDQHVPHAIAVADGGITVEWATAAVVAGITFTSVVCTTRVEYVAIDRGHKPVPCELREEAAGSGVVTQTRFDTPAPGKLYNYWLYLKGITTGAGTRATFDESVDVTLNLGGTLVHDRQTIQALGERMRSELYDAGAEETVTAMHHCHLLFPGQDDIKLSELPDAFKPGELVLSASCNDSGNTSTELIAVYFGAQEDMPASENERQYAASIQPVHFKGVSGFVSEPKAANGAKAVPAAVAGFVPRTLIPTAK